jgi:AraC family transcriptional regulator
MKRAILATIFIIIAFAIVFYVRLGAYKSVTMAATEMGPYHFVFEKHTGPYFKIAAVIDTVEAWAKAHGESCNPSFGEFIDDPNEISEDRLQSRGGCVMSANFKQALPEGAFERTQAKRLYLVAQFDGAPSLGPLKVYDKAGAWMKDQGYQSDGAIIELYTVHSPTSVHTDYLFPIKKQN